MPNLTMSIPHQLPRVEAKQRVEELVQQFQRQSGLGQVNKHWEGDTLHFALSMAGMSLSGQVFVEDQAVRLEVAVPWPFSMLAGNLKKQIEEQGQKLLSRPPV